MLRACLCGRPEDQGRVYLHEFVGFLGDVLAALRKVDEIVSGGRETTRYRIARLSTSRATAHIEAVPRRRMPDNGALVVRRFTEAVIDIEERGTRPSNFSYEAFEAFRRLAVPLRRGIQGVEFEYGTTLVAVTPRLEANIDRVLGREVRSHGTVSGTLELVNVHRAPYTMRVYPIVGPGRVTCRFPKAMLPQVGAALNRYVTVAGVLRYRMEEPFPYEMDVDTLEAHPPEDELPTLGSLRGMAPQLTGDLDTADFIRALRSGEED